MKNLFEVIEKVVEATSLSFLGGTISISSKELLDNFKDTDPIVNFRKQLTSFISKIPKKKLVIIVDELDRCRPDYAMKTLECIKHFFDIEGLFIIIPTNTSALNDCIKSLYGIDNDGRKGKENYFQKFFNDERTIKKPTIDDYLFIIKQYLTNERLKNAIYKNLLSEKDDFYNSIDCLRKYFAHYSYNKPLTVREVKNYSIELCRICNNFYEPIRTEWLCCLMVYRDINNNDNNFVYPLSRKHCLYKDKYKQLEDTNNGKQDLYKLSEYYNSLNDLRPLSYIRDKNNYQVNSRNYFAFINEYINNSRGHINIKNYSDLSAHLSKIKEELNKLKIEYTNCPLVIVNCDIVQKALDNQYAEIEQYQKIYGSDDNDSDRRAKYLKIINSPELIYSVHQ